MPEAATEGRPGSAPRTEVEFATSGHTGTPVSWWRGADQLAYEAALVTDLLVGEVDHVVNFAPTRHLFGHLFGEVLPRTRGVDVHHAWRHAVTDVPPLRSGARTLLVCLPSAWPLLRRLLPALGALPRVVALHSTAAAPQAAKDVVHALRGTGFTAHALLGSTETGAVAHRPVAPAGTDDGPWRLLPDVALVPEPAATPAADAAADAVQPLHVISPRIGRRHDLPAPPDSWRTADLIRRRAPREFDHLGRASRLVKANGVRVWLDAVEAALADALPGLDVTCLPVPDGVRGEHYEIYCAAPGRHGDAAVAGPRLVRRTLARLLPGVPGPRTVHLVDRIPRSAVGKVRIPELRTPERAPAPRAPAPRPAAPRETAPRTTAPRVPELGTSA
ncbi:acyl-CoA synthetase [Streptomyces sp. NPDC018321]|uniref:acyl-CoA synthetase n=1 Tax=unclassified Streptomyces TaxID=2593676 RepID=UPI0037B18C9C